VSSIEWRSAESVLQWCRATVFVAGALGAAGCSHWVPATKSSIVNGPLAADAHRGSDQPERAECERLCAGEANLTGTCQLATLAMAPASSGNVPASGSRVVICEVEVPGYWQREHHWFTPFGRRPPAQVAARGEPPRSPCEHFERAAAHEAAAVRAFRQLAFDLETLDAPPSLLAQARRAARDEANHARRTLAVARCFDPSARLQPDDRRAAPRQLTVLQLALENATAGCVGELFGTWLQVFQARAATHSFVRATALDIARDEAHHAALAFRLFDWLDRQLDPRERTQVRLAMHAEAQRFAGVTMWPEEIASQLGLPNAVQMARAAVALQERLLLACA
jgi:hypothetical protein